MLLEAVQLSRVHGSGDAAVHALRAVNIEVLPGEFIAIMGPSGSGKSTLMNLLALLDRPTSGHLYLKGRNVATLSDDSLSQIRNREIGMIFQSYNLLPRQTVLENVSTPLVYAGASSFERRGRARQALRAVGLADKESRYPAELSGGQQQRVAIARALVSRPSLLLADEPTGALDTETGKQIMCLLRAANRAGSTIIMITHDREVAAEAERVLFIQDGRIHDGGDELEALIDVAARHLMREFSA